MGEIKLKYILIIFLTLLLISCGGVEVDNNLIDNGMVSVCVTHYLKDGLQVVYPASDARATSNGVVLLDVRSRKTVQIVGEVSLVWLEETTTDLTVCSGDDE